MLHQTPRRAALANGTRRASSFRNVALILRFFTQKCRWRCPEDTSPCVGGHGHHGRSFSHTVEENPQLAKARSPGEGWGRHPPKGQGPRKKPTSTTAGLCMATTCPPEAGGAFGNAARLGDTPSRPCFRPRKSFLTGEKLCLLPLGLFSYRAELSARRGELKPKTNKLNPGSRAQAGRGRGDVVRGAEHIWNKLRRTATRARPRQVQDVTALPPAGWDGGKGAGDVGWRHSSPRGLGSPRGGSEGSLGGPLLPPWRCCGVGGPGWGYRGTHAGLGAKEQNPTWDTWGACRSSPATPHS